MLSIFYKVSISSLGLTVWFSIFTSELTSAGICVGSITGAGFAGTGVGVLEIALSILAVKTESGSIVAGVSTTEDCSIGATDVSTTGVCSKEATGVSTTGVCSTEATGVSTTGVCSTEAADVSKVDGTSKTSESKEELDITSLGWDTELLLISGITLKSESILEVLSTDLVSVVKTALFSTFASFTESLFSSAFLFFFILYDK